MHVAHILGATFDDAVFEAKVDFLCVIGCNVHWQNTNVGMLPFLQQLAVVAAYILNFN